MLALSRGTTSYEMAISGQLRLDFGLCLIENFGQACVIGVGPDGVMFGLWSDRWSTCNVPAYTGVIARHGLRARVHEDVMMMKRLSMSFAAGLVSLLLLPAVASSDETKVISWSTYGNSDSYGYGLGTELGHTNWRGYNYGSMAAGFDCHRVFDHTHLDDHTPVVVESTQCYDRIGNAYIVPGSSIIMRLDGTAMISMSSEMLFAFDSAEISGAAMAYLKETALMIRESGATTVTIVGHTDGIGTPDYNKNLSLRRAAAVRDWLVNEGGLADVDFQVAGVGAAEPLLAEQDAEGRDLPDARQANRRVEIVYSTN